MKWLGLVTAGLLVTCLYFAGQDRKPPTQGHEEPHPTIVQVEPSTSDAPRLQTEHRKPASKEKIEKSDFRELLQSAMAVLPTRMELADLDEEEAHGHPRRLREGAQALGEIAQSIKDNPSLTNDAISFYQDCALRSDLPHSIRALCFADFSLFHKNNKNIQSKMPADILELARQVPNTP